MRPQEIEEKDLMKTYNDFRHYGDFVNREDYEKLCMTKISFKYQGKTAVFIMERGEVIRGYFV